MTWLVTNTGWCSNCYSMLADGECDKCEEVTEEAFEELKSELRKVDIGAVWRFVGISDGENEVPSIQEMRGVIGALKGLNAEVAKLGLTMEKRGHKFND